MSSGNGNGSDEDEAPRSIASLRSRFENLAAANGSSVSNGGSNVGINANGTGAKPALASAVGGAPGTSKRSFTPAGNVDIGRGKSAEVDGQAGSKPQPFSSRPSTPVPKASEPLLPSTSTASTTSPPQPPSARLPPPGRPITPKPSFQPPTTNNAATTSSAVTTALAPSTDSTSATAKHLTTASHTPLASPSLSAGPGMTGPVSMPTSPNPGIRRPAPTVPSKPSSLAATPTGSDDGTGPPSSTTADGVGTTDDDRDGEEHILSVKSLRERFSRQPNAESSSSALSGSTPLPRSVSADVQPSKPSKPAAAIPMTSKQISAPVIKRTSTDGKTTRPIPLSPAPESKNEIDLSPSPSPLSAPLPSPIAESSTTAHNHHRPAPPPPPISRSASPAPPAPNRASKPPPRRSPSPTPPPSRSTSSPGLPQNADSAQPTPPQLPQRRPTVLSAEPLDLSNNPPPALPGNKPVFSSALAAEPDGGPGPPPLPNRSRANTISKPEVETVQPSSPAPPPPRLPARHATISSTGIGPPPPSHPSSPSRSRENTNDLLPPPPLRSALMHSASVSSSPPRKRTSSSGDKEAEAYSEDEDDEPDEITPIAGLSATAKRLLEDFPDATEANRRPPNFTPDVRIKDCHHISAFAMFGRHVCTGAHHVRVYDTQLSDHPIFTVDLKETGLDHKAKDPRVTAMCFRPGTTLAEEGRYLWCGTKDGHLWELDITTGSVSNTRSFAHTSAIAHIFRHQKMLLSLDDTGKLLVYDVGDEEGKSPTLIRTLRVMEKFTFAKMLCGKLWTSSGPAARSATSTTTSKGPTIRIYDPCAPGSMPPAKVLFTTEWTGQITSATYIPLKPDTIYLGHEGGFISLWDAKELTCTQVLKISTTDILALEGVGDRLWAGNRKGQISVYDVEERPWLTINVWTGHVDHPVQLLLVDPFSIEHSGRYTCWSFARDSLRAWDGLLSVDWIDKQMVVRQPDYCTFRDINLLVVSWNIDSAKPTDLSGSEANVKFLEDCLRSVDSPDVIVFGFQEVIPLTDKKITAKTLLFGGKNKDSSSTHDKVSQAYRQWLDKLTSAVRQASPPDRPYAKIHSESLVGLFTCIFVKSSEKDSLRDLDITTVKRGLGNIYGNKGAIVSRLIIDDTSICFINVHLAAGQSQKAARNADLAAIMEDKAIFPASEELPFILGGNGTAILDHEMVILNGDMNYRIDQRRENVISSIAAGELPYLLEHDQLRKEMRSNHAFRLRSFEEAPINFAPTYKYNPGTQDYDSSEKRRIPAWCDRILYRKSARIKPINYKRYEPTVSDHRPISGGFTITLKAVDSLRMMDVRRQVAGEWAEKERGMLMKMAEGVEGFS